MSRLLVRLSGRRGDFVLEAALEAPAGAVTALVGPSGSGKSSLLRGIAGLERFEGEVQVGSEVWHRGRAFLAPHRRAVGFVFQHGNLLPHLGVLGNLEFGRKRAAAPRAAVERAVALTRIEPLLGRFPDHLSGGERQRVALARALATEPKLLLLDEPLTGLDAQAKGDLLPELHNTLEALAVPVVYVSHDPAEVRGIADYVLRIEAGRILQLGSLTPPPG